MPWNPFHRRKRGGYVRVRRSRYKRSPTNADASTCAAVSAVTAATAPDLVELTTCTGRWVLGMNKFCVLFHRCTGTLFIHVRYFDAPTDAREAAASGSTAATNVPGTAPGSHGAGIQSSTAVATVTAPASHVVRNKFVVFT